MELVIQLVNRLLKVSQYSELAYDSGVRLIDTAESYGDAHK